MINHDATPVDGGMRPDYQQRMQWPHASMTREVFVEHQHGRLLHRDVDVVEHEGALTFAGRFGHARSRQDAPNGWPSGMRLNTNNIGTMMIEPPSASLSGDAKTTVVAPPPTSGIHMTYRWQAFRGNERGHETPSELMVVPPWRSIRDYNKMDALVRQRSSERWAAKLARRGTGRETCNGADQVRSLLDISIARGTWVVSSRPALTIEERLRLGAHDGV